MEEVELRNEGGKILKETQTEKDEHQDSLQKLKDENDDLKSKLDVLNDQLETIGSYNKPGLPTTKEDIAEIVTAFKASEIRLKQKCLELSKIEESNNELKVRLELEHERRVRAQNEIGLIEKEKVILQKELETKSGECVRLSEECDEIRSNCDYKVNKYTTEIKKLEAKLEKVVLEKDKKIFDLQDKNTELYLKLESAEETNASQLEVATTLQNELQGSYAETSALIKEMEMLNLMFAELDEHIFPTETKDDAATAANESNIEVTENGKQVNVEEVLNVAQSTDYSPSLLQKSCFNEVTTKHGTKMVLSVSKTFLKLKDLILEKNTLEEQMSKMKHINDTLCKQVNIHEEKLCGITDELNNTWFYVSKIKEQHKKMHSAEQILRAELAEKRQLLKNIRKELEETRASWNIVKQKNAESEIQWLKLKADCEERRRILMSSSESGFSELGMTDKTDDTDVESEGNTSPEVLEQIREKTESPVMREAEEESESEEIPDPFSDEDDEIEEIPQHFVLPVVTTTVSDDTEDEEEEEDMVEPEEEKPGTDASFTPIFVPSMSYLAQVPSEMQPELLSPNEKELRALEEAEARPSRDRVDEKVFEEAEVDDNVRNLIIRLSSSTARGAFLANRLADIHRRIATGTSLTDHNDWFDTDTATEEEETETDLMPRHETETEEEDELTVPSPEIQSEFEEVEEELPALAHDGDEEEEEYGTPGTSEDEDDLSRPGSVDSLVLAIDEAINILDPVNSQPQLASFLSVSSTSPPVTEMRPAFLTDQEEEEEEDDDDSDLLSAVVGGGEHTGAGVQQSSGVSAPSAAPAPDSSTAVTRYLIKHLPKQLTALRNQKHELEDKIHDLEQVVSEQRTQMAEYERRAEVEKSRAKKLEDSLHQVRSLTFIFIYLDDNLFQIEEKVDASEAKMDPVVLAVTYKVPVVVEEEDTMLTWTVDTLSEVSTHLNTIMIFTILRSWQNVCGYYISFVTRGDSADNAVILPNMVTEVIPGNMGIITSLQCPASYLGTYTLHIEGNGAK